ncbi:hypothetical protein [Natronorubrum aibiense]|uniref:hypothetical protein n=1 Tax=Natronorubrum aibiense TaxID=348826 RepID=UPI001456AEFC|nr:hypothetical protein [Natronorubrum aibiense]
MLPERLATFGDQYREQRYLTRSQLYDIDYEFSTHAVVDTRVWTIFERFDENG